MALGDTLPQTLAMRMLESEIAACILYKLVCRIRPYERDRGAADRAFSRSADLVSAAILAGTDVKKALAEGAELFRGVPRRETAERKPRIAILGDFFVKYNDLVNGKLPALVEELDGEIILTSMTEYAAHFLDLGVRQYGEDPRSARILRTIEKRFEKIAEDLIGDQEEPDFGECARLMEQHGLSHYIAGETSINVGRALYYCAHRSVDAIVHINPIFCCPGVVSASLFRKIQQEFGIPVIDIFYDGTGNPNQVLIPHLHYLRQRLGSTGPAPAFSSPPRIPP
jgi:predicted nucleotide-binding protein (sugar kinase/HSP70/actin superfamily)